MRWQVTVSWPARVDLLAVVGVEEAGAAGRLPGGEVHRAREGVLEPLIQLGPGDGVARVAGLE
ncbi:hypothetical protein [Magnetospira thiophila]